MPEMPEGWKSYSTPNWEMPILGQNIYFWSLFLGAQPRTIKGRFVISGSRYCLFETETGKYYDFDTYFPTWKVIE